MTFRGQFCVCFFFSFCFQFLFSIKWEGQITRKAPTVVEIHCLNGPIKLNPSEHWHSIVSGYFKMYMQNKNAKRKRVQKHVGTRTTDLEVFSKFRSDNTTRKTPFLVPGTV